MEPLAIRTEGLRRVFKKPPKRGRASGRDEAEPADRSDEFLALDGVDLQVRPGELFGLLGPNGAGKTTLIKILTTLLAPSSGSARVDGLDVVTQAREIRPRINMVSGGESSGYGVLNVRENLWLFTQIYGVSSRLAWERIDRMLEIVDLTDKARTRIRHLSTGQRQKMNFARGFLTDPKILFLDEPTLGLDVTSARRIRLFLKEWMKERPERTLLLTTHYMTEADELCDRLAIIDNGKLLACDTPAGLKRRVQEYALFDLRVTPSPGLAAAVKAVRGVRQVAEEESPDGIALKLALEEEGVIGEAVQAVVAAGSRVRSLNKVEATLEDVFIELVGRGLNDESAGGARHGV